MHDDQDIDFPVGIPSIPFRFFKTWKCVGSEFQFLSA